MGKLRSLFMLKYGQASPLPKLNVVRDGRITSETAWYSYAATASAAPTPYDKTVSAA